VIVASVRTIAWVPVGLAGMQTSTSTPDRTAWRIPDSVCCKSHVSGRIKATEGTIFSPSFF
jgi:hypothetical protein